MLTAKQQLFVAEYLKDLNATAAYKRAGYKGQGNSAESTASQLLSNPKVAQAVQEAMDKRARKVDIDAEYVLRTIKDTIERCAQAEPVRDREGNETGEYKFDSTAVLRGAELLGKHLKMFTDKTEHSNPDGSALFTGITVKFVKPDDNG